MGYLIVIVLLFGVLWFVLIRPQRRRQLEQQQMLRQVGVGDEIITAGGIYGRITAAHDDELTLEIAPGTAVRLDRRAVAARVTPDEAAEPEEPEQIPPAEG